MKLNTEERFGSMAESLIGTVVGIKKPGLPVLRQTFFSYCVTVVLRGDITTLRSNLYARLILTAMTEFQLVRRCAGCACQQLVSKTNAENRLSYIQNLSNSFNCGFQQFGIARSVGYNKPVEAFTCNVPIPWNRFYRQTAPEQQSCKGSYLPR